MSFDYKRGDNTFSDHLAADYDLPVNFPLPGGTRKKLRATPQHHGVAKRMVVIKPKAEAKPWTREAELTPVGPVFKRLLEDIQLKYGQQSSLQGLLFSDEYLAVIGFGPRVVPLLLADLKTGNTPWFWALKAITRENIGGNVAPGDMRSLRDAWLAWGVSKGLL